MSVEDVEADDRDEDDDEFRKEEESFEEVVRTLEELRVKRDDLRDILVCLLNVNSTKPKHLLYVLWFVESVKKYKRNKKKTKQMILLYHGS